ncbi:hypothetical protein L3Y34_012885 [Caenorhabditis briggsae]|uniref:Uncharacterized protein n=1 Tax=Caenorhabditis briggsae TaxID=6238 RepID=A0AAE9CW15_CAEBR|nr:hypothetical protein L3Y34_012885 [Caenorhabditis briggsae]
MMFRVLLAFCLFSTAASVTLVICQQYCSSVQGAASYDNCAPWNSYALASNQTCYNLCVHNCAAVYDGSWTLESSRFGIDGQRDTHMLPKTNLIQYLAAYQQQLLARSGIILPLVMLPNSSPVPPLISSSRSKGYEIPPTFPKPVEVISDRQK